MRRAAYLVAVGGLVTAPAAAQLTPRQAIDRRGIGDLRFAPDGRSLAFVVTEPPRGATRNSDIWILDLGSGQSRQFTRSPKSDNTPRWAPDGRRIAFLSARDGATQIFLLDLRGGEPARLTDGNVDVQGFDWSPDGSRIGFLAADPRSDDAKRKAEDKDDARVVDRDDRPTRLWLMGVDSLHARPLTAAPWDVSEARWSRDGARLFAVATDAPHSDRWNDRLIAVDTGSGAVSVLATPHGPWGRIAPSPDGSHIGYVGARTDGPTSHDLYALPLNGGAARNLTAGSVDRPVGSYEWRADGSLITSVATGFTSALYALQPDGRATRIPDAGANPSTLAVASTGTVAFVGQTAVDPPEVWIGTPPGAFTQATHVNAGTDRLALTRPERFQLRSFDGIAIEAQTLTPRAAAGTRPPLVVIVHGGPTGRWSDAFEPWGQLLVSRGYLVLYVNVRGSTGYGQRFMELNRGDWGGGDFKDVMAALDYVIDRRLADPERLGIAGWSYGGYMAAWAITQTNRFKAAVAGAGMSDLASEFGTEGSSAYDEWFYGTPYERPEGFIKSSPMTYIKNARTPTLILQGEEDRTDPIGQSQQLYRGLKRYHVESEFVVYPREPHGLREEKHILDMLTRIVEWFDSHLQPVSSASP